MENEIWKPVEGIKDGFYDGLYEVSNLGRFKMLPRWLNSINGGRVTKEKITYGTNSHGYRTITMKKNRIKYQIDLHVLIAKIFLPNIEKKPTVNHKDRNRANNRIENLEWATQQEQVDHAFSTGEPIVMTKGEQRANAKLTESKVIAMRDMYVTKLFSYRILSQMFGISPTIARYVIKKKKWAHVA